MDAVTEGEQQQPLSEQEFGDLCRLEKVVEGGLKQFMEVGQALLEILERKLYRATHGTWDSYCRDRWKFGRQRAFRLIQASVVATELASRLPTGQQVPQPENERQVRELARVPPSLRKDVWSAGAELSGGQAPKASKIQEIMAKVNKSGWVDKQTLVREVQAEEEAVAKDGQVLAKEAREDDARWRLARGRWHLKRARRLFEGCGGDCDRAIAMIDEADRLAVEDFGEDVPASVD